MSKLGQLQPRAYPWVQIVNTLRSWVSCPYTTLLFKLLKSLLEFPWLVGLCVRMKWFWTRWLACSFKRYKALPFVNKVNFGSIAALVIAPCCILLATSTAGGLNWPLHTYLCLCLQTYICDYLTSMEQPMAVPTYGHAVAWRCRGCRAHAHLCVCSESLTCWWEALQIAIFSWPCRAAFWWLCFRHSCKANEGGP